ncbi:Malonyl CoA-acyl carrier protein transacylase [compost metagenome]
MSKTAFLFPGQGSQFVGMGKKLQEQFAMAKCMFEEANDVLGIDLAKLCFEGSHLELMQTMNTQPAILAVSVIAFEVGRQELGWEPHLLAGHSLGEYSALVASGVVSFQDGLRIVRKRGILMQSTVSSGLGAMAAVINAPKEQLEQWCRQISTENKQVVISCFNSLHQHVIAGHKEAVQHVVDKLEAAPGVIVKYLNVSAPFHSPLMRPAADQLAVELEKYETRAGKWPIISNVTANTYGREEMSKLLYRQMTHPVRWLETMDYLYRNGVSRTVELGPKQVLTQLMNNSYPAIKTYHFDNPLELEQLHAVFDAEQNSLTSIITCIQEALTAAVISRSRNQDPGQYMNGVISPINHIKKLIEQISSERKTNLSYTMSKIREQLELILTTKQLSIEEQERIIRKLPLDKANVV